MARKTQNAQISAPLTDIQVRNAKPKAKAYTLANGGGMYLEIALTGSNTRLTFGPYPEVPFLDARQKRIDKINKATANANTFEAVAPEWHDNNLRSWRPRTAKNILHRLEIDVFPLPPVYTSLVPAARFSLTL